MLFRLYRSVVGRHRAPEDCFYIDLATAPKPDELELLRWLISEPLTTVANDSRFSDSDIVEIGPRISIETPFSSNAVAICQAMGLPVRRIERSTRHPLGGSTARELVEKHLDRTT